MSLAHRRSSLARPRARFDLKGFRPLALGLVLALSACEPDAHAPNDKEDEKDPSSEGPGGPEKPGAGGDKLDASTGGPVLPKMDASKEPSGPQTDAASAADAANMDNSTADGSIALGDAGSSGMDAGPDGSTGPDAAVDAGTRGDGGGRRCGTRGAARCGNQQFCNFEPDKECGATDRGGVCESRPEVCTLDYNPVCGCNGRTYSNACSAHNAGISVQRTGACEPDDTTTGAMCGGIAGIACDDGAFCNYEPAAGGQGCVNIADGAGRCQPTPRGCTREYQPVCGCNRHTYSNTCTAHQAGVSVMREQACTDNDCQAIGGDVVFRLGPAPVCTGGKVSAGPVRLASGQMPIEGAICCI